MKKTINILLFMIFLIPSILGASTFEQSRKIASNYLDNNDYKNTYDRYLLSVGSLPDYDIFKITLLSEKNKSNSPSYSYLFDGTIFWTLSSKSDNNYYTVSQKIDSSLIATNSTPHTKSVVSVKSGTLVTGLGKINNPWIFVDKYKATLTTNDSSKGKLSSKPCSDSEANPQEKMSLIYGTGTVSYLCAESGYKYVNNTCSSALSYDKNNKALFIDSIQRDIKCTVNFGIDTLNITLKNPEGTQDAKPQNLYLAYTKGWYSDSIGTKPIKKLTSLPVRPGYKFLGYYEKENGEGKLIVDELGNIQSDTKTFTNKNISIYSYWKENVLTIKYNANGGIANTNGYSVNNKVIYKDGEPLITKLKYSEALPTTGLINPNNKDYLFITREKYDIVAESEWCDSTSKTRCFDANNATYKTYDFCPNISNGDCTVELMVNWTPFYYITMHSNYGVDDTVKESITSAAIESTLENIFKMDNGHFTRDGYTFEGWSQNKNATAAPLIPILDVPKLLTYVLANGSLDLYAVWKPITYTVSYNGNGNTGGIMSSSNYTYDTVSTLKANEYTKTGYVFAGWSKTAGGSVEFTNSQSFKNLAKNQGQTVTLYAVWRREEVKITYEGPGAKEYPIPYSGTYKIEAYGASGGNADSFSGGKGGYSYGSIYLTAGTVLYMHIGGVGENGRSESRSGCLLTNENNYVVTSGGYNGGVQGHGYNYNCQSMVGHTLAGAGGGATHVALVNGVLSSLASQKGQILLVAGGGGGAISSTDHNYDGNGGAGGGGNNPGGNGSSGAPGGSISSGTFGTGVTGSRSYAGGGAGLYGGKPTQGTEGHGSAGGGSGYISNTLTSSGGSSGVRTGAGRVIITLLN